MKKMLQRNPTKFYSLFPSLFQIPLPDNTLALPFDTFIQTTNQNLFVIWVERVFSL